MKGKVMDFSSWFFARYGMAVNTANENLRAYAWNSYVDYLLENGRDPQTYMERQSSDC